jgi:hypothetical protein
MKPIIFASLIGLSSCAAGTGVTGGVVGSLLGGAGLAPKIVEAGQLVCFADGIYASMSTPVAQPVSVKDQTAAFVAAVCAAWNPSAIPVAPPAAAVVQPATVVVPSAKS